MQFIKIDGTAYNLAHLVSFSYKQDSKDVMRQGFWFRQRILISNRQGGFTVVAEFKFIECKEIEFKNEAANVAWRTILDVLNPSPVAELLTRIPPQEPKSSKMYTVIQLGEDRRDLP